MKKISTFIALSFCVVLIAGCTPAANNTNNSSVNNQTNMPQSQTDTSPAARFNKYKTSPGKLPAEQISKKKSILTTDKGVIEIKLFDDEAPYAVSNHIFLVNDGFYDGLTFHRREEGFVIQGGDPLGTGFGGPGYSFGDEKVTRRYTRGIVAMANAGPNTNGSQFFIMLADVNLPPNYTIFGEVISDLHVIDQIKVGDKITSAKIVDLE